MSKWVAAGALLSLMGVGVASGDAPLVLTSPDLPAGKQIDAQFTADAWGCHGANESPELKWHNVPAGTKSLAVTMFDPYRPPQSGWWHWLVYDIPATTTGLPRGAGAPASSGLPPGARQAKPDGEAPQPHYYGPCPDAGDPPHHYVISVYALSVEHLKIPETATAADVDSEISAKSIGKAQLVRLYARPKKTE